MNNSLDRLIDGLIATVRAEIIPRLDDEFARGQAYGVVDILNNLKPRIDWLATPLVDEVREQEALLSELAAQFGDNAGFPGASPVAAQLQAGATAHDIELLRNRLDQQICASIDWLGEQRATLPAEKMQAIEAQIKNHLQRQLKRELSLTPKPLFGEISKG
ncbi:MAG TPA: hypothetical protein VLC91_13130 [Spongiibacteraceae bacterium]|nr:hypothetical protein [Spongiibacteraceae bacterium]